MTRLSTIGALAVVALATAPALAQEGESPSGEGYRLSEGTVLHSSAGVRGGYVSNVFYDDDNRVGAGVLRAGGDLRIASREVGDGATQRLTFDAGLGLDYREFLSGNPNARAQRDLDIDAFGGLVLFPGGKVSFTLDDTLTRRSRPTNFESSSNFNRLVNEFEAGPDWTPGGGSLTFGLRYRNTTDLFEDGAAPYADRMHHSGHLRASYRLFPVTRLFFDGEVGYYDHFGEAALEKSRATSYGATLGAATAITTRTHATGYAGYRYLAYDAGENFSGVVGGASVSHRYSPLGQATLGYERRVSDSINANFYTDHRIHAKAEQQFDRLLASLEGDVRFRDYVGVPAVVGGAETRRDDLIVSSGANVRYMLPRDMSASLSYRISRVQTDFESAFEDDDPSYVRHAVFAGFRASF